MLNKFLIDEEETSEATRYGSTESWTDYWNNYEILKSENTIETPGTHNERRLGELTLRGHIES